MNIYINYIQKAVLFCLFYLAVNTSFSQILLKGQVLKDDSVAGVVDQVMIINRTENTGTFSDIQGRFSILADSNALLIFKKLGYKSDTIRMKSFKHLVVNNTLYKNIYLKPLPIQLAPFTISYKKVVLDPVERRKEWSYVLDRVHASAQSPITALYQQFSKKGKELRKLEALYYEDDRKRYVEARFSRFKAILMTGLVGESLDLFLRSCRPSYEYMLLVSDYELVLRMEQCYEDFKLTHPEILDKINFNRAPRDSTSQPSKE